MGDAVPLPLPPGVPDLETAELSSGSCEGCCCCCWDANEDNVVGDGTALAVSIDTGRGLGRVGMENERAREAREGKFEPEPRFGVSGGGGVDGGCV